MIKSTFLGSHRVERWLALELCGKTPLHIQTAARTSAYLPDEILESRQHGVITLSANLNE